VKGIGAVRMPSQYRFLRTCTPDPGSASSQVREVQQCFHRSTFGCLSAAGLTAEQPSHEAENQSICSTLLVVPTASSRVGQCGASRHCPSTRNLTVYSPVQQGVRMTAI
jgi:hypothetical protein